MSYEYLTIYRAALKWGVTSGTVHTWIRKGIIITYKPAAKVTLISINQKKPKFLKGGIPKNYTTEELTRKIEKKSPYKNNKIDNCAGCGAAIYSGQAVFKRSISGESFCSKICLEKS